MSTYIIAYYHAIALAIPAPIAYTKNSDYQRAGVALSLSANWLAGRSPAPNGAGSGCPWLSVLRAALPLALELAAPVGAATTPIPNA